MLVQGENLNDPTRVFHALPRGGKIFVGMLKGDSCRWDRQTSSYSRPSGRWCWSGARAHSHDCFALRHVIQRVPDQTPGLTDTGLDRAGSRITNRHVALPVHVDAGHPPE